ncbi:MAG: hypothetical protein WAX77_03430 [Methylococcaceae bacterium]
MTFTEISELVIPAAALLSVASLFLSGKKDKAEESAKKPEPTIAPVVFTKDASGLTGVAKYLAQQAQEVAALAAQQVEETVTQPVVSRVAKYLEERDRTPVSGVTKYTLRQAIAAKQAKQNVPTTKLTGVDKYLKTQKPAPVLSGVAKYLKHQESLPQPSRVAKYMAKQAIASKQTKQATVSVELTGVAKYLKQQDSLPQPSRVAKYMAKQAILAKQAKKAEVPVVVTGVAKYLTQQDSLPKTSRVAKYITRQNLVAKQNPVVVRTGVEKYLHSQNQ